MHQHKCWKLFRGRSLKKRQSMVFLTLLIGLSYSLAQAAGSWNKDWADAPDEGYQNWTNQTNTIKWYPTFKWYVGSIPTANRRIELELYDPANNNHCDRLEPSSLVEAGGDWIDTWTTTNECGGSKKERYLIDLKENNIAANTWYQAVATANKIYTASYGGETNVSYTCWLCGDDWLGKQVYDASYNDGGSTP